MRRLLTIRAAALGGLAVLWSLHAVSGANPASAETAPGQVQTQPGLVTTLDDQVDLALTVYNSGIALIRDVRDVRLGRGAGNLEFADISATVNPATVHLRSLSEPGRLSVLEQNYEYDLLEPEKLLRKYLGREVTLIRSRQDSGTTREEEVTATLLALNNGPVWRIGNEIVTGIRVDHFRFPSVPANLHSRPTLIWTVNNDGGERHRVEASYLTGQINWNADYVLTVDRSDTSASLAGWVTLNNQSGTAFNNARLQLVAGDLNRVTAEDERRDRLAVMAGAQVAESAFARETFSEYHLYSLGRRTTIQDKETKQVGLLDASGAPIVKAYVVEGQQFYYHNAQHPGAPLKDPVQVYYRFRNDEKSGLGLPLPAGTVRVYQADTTGGLQFAGEDRISHTPKDETINLKVGHAFDVVSERRQTDFEEIATSVYEMEFEITLRNHKPAPITVEVHEPIGGTWQMLRASHQWTKTSAWAARFDVTVGADETAVLTYRVRVKW